MRNPQPELIVFDVNETLSDLAPLSQRFAAVGAPEHSADLWFTSVLRDGFALAAAGTSESFADIAAALLRVQLPEAHLNRSLPDAVAFVMDGFGDLSVHPDVVEAVHALADAGIRLVTMSNGATAVAERLLTAAGIVGRFEHLLSVEDAGVWKPARQAYHYALERCAVGASDAMLVAVHPWDIDGARRAGLRTAWINRAGASYPAHLLPAEVVASSLVSLADLFVR